MSRAPIWKTSRASSGFSDHGGVITNASDAGIGHDSRPVIGGRGRRGVLPACPWRLAKTRKRSWQVWRDASGRLSALRIGTLAFLLLPVAIAVYDYNTVGFGARPINDVIHRTGYWALMFLMISLAVTPLRRDRRASASCSTCAA